MAEFVRRHGLTFGSLIDEDGDLFSRFGVPYQPAWVFVATDGTLTRVQGTLTAEKVDEIVATLD